MLIAQISDLHVVPEAKLLYDFVDSNRILAKTAAIINGLGVPADLVLVTGDTANTGNKESYAMLTSLLENFQPPVFVIPGNHDSPALLRQAGGGKYHRAAGVKMDYVIEEFPLRIIMLDSTVPGEIHGWLTPEQLDWLEKALAQDARQTLVCIHHPPLPTGHAHMDPLRCLNGEDLVRILQKYPQVQALFCGHTHRAIFQRIGSLSVLTAPGLGTSIKSDFIDNRGFFTPDENAFMLHSFTPEKGLVSFVETLPKNIPHSFSHVNWRK